MRYGIVGAGMMGQEHIRNIALLDDAEVVAVADPHDGQRAVACDLAGPQCRGYAGHAELLAAASCDVLVVATPNDTHHPVLLDVLASDLPVLVEKPLCINPQQCQEVVKLADTRAAPVWVGMEYRYMPPLTRLVEAVRAGAAGQVQMIAIREHRFPFLAKVGDWNRFHERTGGTLVEKCCHFFDLFRLISGSEAVRVYASGGTDVNFRDEKYAGRTSDMLDNAYVIVDFANGVRGMLDLCMFAEGSRWQEEVVATGASGQVIAQIPGSPRDADKLPGPARFAVVDRATQTVDEKEVSVDDEILAAGHHYGSCLFQHRRFQKMLAERSAPEVSCADGLAAVVIGHAAEQSVRSKQAVDL